MDLLTLALAKNHTNNQRLAYEEDKVIHHEVELTDEGGFSVGSKSGRLGLEVGKTYRVALDSGVYDAVCRSIEEVVEGGTLTICYLGNIGAFNAQYPDTGERFLIAEECDVSMEAKPWNVSFLDFDKSKKCAIYSGGEIHGIDPKFLPKGGFGWTDVCEHVMVFDGDITGKEHVEMSNNVGLVRIGPCIDFSTVKEVKMTLHSFGIIDCQVIDVFVDEEGGAQVLGNAENGEIFAIATPKDLAVEEFVLSEGTWFSYFGKLGGSVYVTCEIKYSSEKVNKIDQKYLPDYLGSLEEGPTALTYDGTSGEIIDSEIGSFVKVSDEPVNLDDDFTVEMYVNSSQQALTKDQLMYLRDSGGEIVMFSEEIILIANIKDDVIDGLTPGVYFSTNIGGDADAYVSALRFADKIRPIDERLIPKDYFYKTIDLGKYTFVKESGEEDTVDSVLFRLSNQASLHPNEISKVSGNFNNDFWNEVDVKVPLRFVDYLNGKTTIDGCTIERSLLSFKVVAVCFNFPQRSGDQLYNVNIYIGRSSESDSHGEIWVKCNL